MPSNFFTILLLLFGFFFLIKGADFFVDGASSIAKNFRVPPLVIGLTIVAFGTSAPEAAVSISSALKGQNDITLGNVIGSNIFNFLCVVGSSAVICPFKVKRSIILKEFPLTILSCVVVLLLSADLLLADSTANVLQRQDGFILLLFFGIFLYYIIHMAITNRESTTEDVKLMPLPKSILLSIIGIIGIVLGGDMVVDGASTIAVMLGMSQTLVGLTIVAIGTSLPELVTSIVAARKGESDIALGNVIGSNLFNVFFILGLSATLNPININPATIIDTVILLAITLLVYFFAISGKRIQKLEGSILLLLYLLYMAYIIIRN